MVSLACLDSSTGLPLDWRNPDSSPPAPAPPSSHLSLCELSAVLASRSFLPSGLACLGFPLPRMCSLHPAHSFTSEFQMIPQRPHPSAHPTVPFTHSLFPTPCFALSSLQPLSPELSLMTQCLIVFFSRWRAVTSFAFHLVCSAEVGAWHIAGAQ